jgi:hypothetical protein
MDSPENEGMLACRVGPVCLGRTVPSPHPEIHVVACQAIRFVQLGMSMVIWLLYLIVLWRGRRQLKRRSYNQTKFANIFSRLQASRTRDQQACGFR